MDHYKVLGVSHSATPEEIKAAFRRKAREFHPDVNKTPDAEDKFKEINEAYEFLKKPPHLRESPRQHSETQYSGFNERNANFEDLFRHYQTRKKNKDVALNYSITLEEAFTGVKANVKYRNGDVYSQVFVDIPAGVATGHRIFYPHRGQTSVYAEAGDLNITIIVKDHTLFQRDGDNLIGTVEVDYLEAIVGDKVEISCLDGSKLLVTIPPLHPVDKELRIKGKGMPSHTGFGDLKVFLSVKPPVLNEDGMKIIRDAVSKINDSKT